MSELAAKDLGKVYGTGESSVQVFHDLNLSVGNGRLVAVVGPSGSGKSTLLHLLGGLDRPTAGTVLLDGVDVFAGTQETLATFRNRSIGFVFQFHHLLPEFTALENAMMPLIVRGRPRDEAIVAARDILRRVGLERRETHRVGEMSGGEQQRVAIARALAGNPKFLLADEPTGNLDGHTGAAVFEMIRELHRERGLSTVIVTHNERIAEQCDEVWQMGRLAPDA